MATKNRRRSVMALWHALPMITVVLALIPLALPKYITSVTEVLPPLPLLVVFYWCMEHPKRLGYRGVFAAGLMYDAIVATPFGLSALLWGVFRYLLMSARKDVREQGFIVGWGYLALLLLAALGAQWGVMSLFYGRSYHLGPVLLQWCLGALLYPSAYMLLYTIERQFHRRWWFMLKPA